MKWDGEIMWCVKCGIEITWGAIIKKGRPYCCEDCSQGRPCSCADSQELDLEIRTRQDVSGDNAVSIT